MHDDAEPISVDQADLAGHIVAQIAKVSACIQAPDMGVPLLCREEPQRDELVHAQIVGLVDGRHVIIYE